MRSHWTEKMKIKDFLQDFWKESRSKKRGQSVKYADCPRLHYAVCVMQINVYFFLHSQKHPNAGIITPLASISCPEIRSVYMPSSSLIHATLS